MPDLPPPRSYLYAPGTSERILAKVLDAGADVVVLDLEDSVEASRKLAAREAVAAFLDEHQGRVSPEIHVRVNGGQYGFDTDDVSGVLRPGLAALRVPKCDSPRTLRLLDTILTNLERERGLPRGGVGVYPILESAAGIEHAAEIAASPRVVRLCFGAADFLADIGARGDAHGPATVYARSRMVVASRVAGIGAPVDSVHTALRDLDGLREGAVLARDMGFFGKSVIHPDQLDVVHQVFTPDEAELAWARRVLEAYDQARSGGEAALSLDGEFIDPAVVSRARGVLALARGEAS